MNDFRDFVEARITGIALLDESKTVRISLRGQAKQCFTLIAEGVDRIVVNEFREQNIVDRLTVWDSKTDPTEYRSTLVSLISGLIGDAVDPAWNPVIEREIEAISLGSKVLIEMEPVFGASVILLARKFTAV